MEAGGGITGEVDGGAGMSAKEQREAFVDGVEWAQGFIPQAAEAEALRRYPDPPTIPIDDSLTAAYMMGVANEKERNRNKADAPESMTEEEHEEDAFAREVIEREVAKEEPYAEFWMHIGRVARRPRVGEEQEMTSLEMLKSAKAILAQLEAWSGGKYKFGSLEEDRRFEAIDAKAEILKALDAIQNIAVVDDEIEAGCVDINSTRLGRKLDQERDG
jgi:hypothetical protein